MTAGRNGWQMALVVLLWACGGRGSAGGDAGRRDGDDDDASGEGETGADGSASIDAAIDCRADRYGCPPEAPYCCYFMDGGVSVLCYPDWPGPSVSPMDYIACTPEGPPYVTSDYQGCYDPETHRSHPDRCPDSLPYCCPPVQTCDTGPPCGRICTEPDCTGVCADRDVAGWNCSR